MPEEKIFRGALFTRPLHKTLMRYIILTEVRDMKNTKMIASGAMLAALCVVLMLLGAVLELGMYAAPLLAGVLLIPYGSKYGIKAQLTAFAAVALLSFILVSNAEQNLMFAGFFGWYPMIRQHLSALPRLGRLVLKLVIFNAAVIAVELLVMKLIAPEFMAVWMLVLLLVLGNLTFLLYDMLIPRLERTLGAYIKFM